MNRKKISLNLALIISKIYGNVFDEIIYTKGVGISGKIRFAEINNEVGTTIKKVNDIVSTIPEHQINDNQHSGQNFSGYVWAEDFLRTTNENNYMEILVEFSKKYSPNHKSTLPYTCDPTYRSEDIFFSSSVLGRVYKYTKESKFSNILSNYLINIPTQTKDGLFMHNLESGWNWGRSNGFAAIGYSEALTYLYDNKNKTEFADILEKHILQIEALVKIQNEDGTWMQVLNEKSSYHEFSVTCMLGYALARGIRMGWLDPKFSESLNNAFDGIASRIDKTGKIKKVCVGTGVQNSLKEYLNRPAISGFDHRGGSLLLWFLTEFILLQDSQKSS